MSEQALDQLRDAHGFDPTPHPRDLSILHVPFAELAGVDVERRQPRSRSNDEPRFPAGSLARRSGQRQICRYYFWPRFSLH